MSLPTKEITSYFQDIILEYLKTSLLDKYADKGIANLSKCLKVSPLNEFGSPIEILREFGGKERFLAAVRGLEERFIKWRELSKVQTNSNVFLITI